MINAITLSLDLREESWKKLNEQCKQAGISNYNFIVGSQNFEHLHYDFVDPEVDTSNWYYGSSEKTKRCHKLAFLSHREILKMAWDEGWEYFLLLEDDTTILVNRFNRVKNSILDWISSEKFDLLYLGWWQNENNYPLVEEKYKNEGIFYIDKVRDFVGGAHALVINRSIIPLLLSLEAVDPMDSQINRIIGHNNILSLMVSPKLFIVPTCWSYGEDCLLERKPVEDD